MDIRVLEYFLTVAREESITAAAESLHMTQPPLSRQLKELEQELGATLFIRGSRRITLTEEGVLLRKRAAEIIALAEKTKVDIATTEGHLTGTVSIGVAETESLRFIVRSMKTLRKRAPEVHFTLYSGNAEAVSDRLDKGLLDFGIFVEPADISRYEFITLPRRDTWGLLMRKDDALAAREAVTMEDLRSRPLLLTSQQLADNEFAGWAEERFDQLHIIARYNLPFSAALMVEEGLGCALMLDRIISTGPESLLTFRPLAPALTVGIRMGWKKYQTFSRAAAAFLRQVQKDLKEDKVSSGEM